MCAICKTEGETIEHILLKCKGLIPALPEGATDVAGSLRFAREDGRVDYTANHVSEQTGAPLAVAHHLCRACAMGCGQEARLPASTKPLECDVVGVRPRVPFRVEFVDTIFS